MANDGRLGVGESVYFKVVALEGCHAHTSSTKGTELKKKIQEVWREKCWGDGKELEARKGEDLIKHVVCMYDII